MSEQKNSFPPTLKQLRYLVAVARTLHFGRAADSVHVTQSTLSAGLQELESLLNSTLVERSKRSVMLTPLGEQVVARAQSILNDVDDLIGLAATARNPYSGVIKLGVIPTIAPFLLPRVMPAIQRDLPDMTLNLREDKSAELCALLRSGDLDCVLYALPFTCGDMAELPLFADPFVAAFQRAQAPADDITSQQLQTQPLLLLEEGHCLRDHALDACALNSPTAQGGFSGTSLHTIVQMVASGQGATLLPQMAVDAHLIDGLDITIRGFKDLVPARTIGLIWRKTSPRTESYEKLGAVIKAAACAGRGEDMAS